VLLRVAGSLLHQWWRDWFRDNGIQVLANAHGKQRGSTHATAADHVDVMASRALIMLHVVKPRSINAVVRVVDVPSRTSACVSSRPMPWRSRVEPWFCGTFMPRRA